MHWEDKHIIQSENEYICFDHRGEYINSTSTLTEARKIVEAYANELRSKNIIRTVNESVRER